MWPRPWNAPRSCMVGQGGSCSTTARSSSRRSDLWAYLHGIELDFSRPGKPTDNAFAESFNGKFRTECLNVYWFLSLDDARSKCEAWRTEYNEERPHSAIGNQTPVAWALASGQACLT